MQTGNRYAPPRAEVRDVQDTQIDEAPPLWNPAAAANWSLLFTPVFGAALHMKNWQALGEPEKARQAKGWMIGSIVYLVIATGLAAVLPETRNVDALMRSAGLAMLLAWYFSSGRAQQKYVKERFGKDYARRGWGKPIGYTVLVFLGLFAAAMVVALFADPGTAR